MQSLQEDTKDENKETNQLEIEIKEPEFPRFPWIVNDKKMLQMKYEKLFSVTRYQLVKNKPETHFSVTYIPVRNIRPRYLLIQCEGHNTQYWKYIIDDICYGSFPIKSFIVEITDIIPSYISCNQAKNVYFTASDDELDVIILDNKFIGKADDWNLFRFNNADILDAKKDRLCVMPYDTKMSDTIFIKGYYDALYDIKYNNDGYSQFKIYNCFGYSDCLHNNTAYFEGYKYGFQNGGDLVAKDKVDQPSIYHAILRQIVKKMCLSSGDNLLLEVRTLKLIILDSFDVVPDLNKAVYHDDNKKCEEYVNQILNDPKNEQI